MPTTRAHSVELSGEGAGEGTGDRQWEAVNIDSNMLHLGGAQEGLQPRQAADLPMDNGSGGHYGRKGGADVSEVSLDPRWAGGLGGGGTGSSMDPSPNEFSQRFSAGELHNGDDALMGGPQPREASHEVPKEDLLQALKDELLLLRSEVAMLRDRDRRREEDVVRLRGKLNEFEGVWGWEKPF